MILLYMASHFLAEAIFSAATIFFTFFPILAMLLLHFGSCGRLIACKRKTRRFLHGGVISGNYRQMYYDKCIKSAPPALRLAYRGFLEGEISAHGFATRVMASVKDRRRLFLGSYFGIAASLSLLVFLVFYFISPFSETLLRSVITAFVALSNGTALRFLLYGYTSAARKSAVCIAEMLDARLLREKGDPLLSLRHEEDDRQTDRLRALLREVQGSAEA